MTNPDTLRPEANRYNEPVQLSCSQCGKVLVDTTIGIMSELRQQGNLSGSCSAQYLAHMIVTGHVGLTSSHPRVNVENLPWRGTVAIQLKSQ